jgi:lipoprotein-anchoring transpeptidase ErfK/SrfK
MRRFTFLFGLAAAAACSQPQVTFEGPSNLPAGDGGGLALAADGGTHAPRDASMANLALDAGDFPRIGALFLQTPIMSDMEWPAKDDEDALPKRKKEKDRVMRIGYLRQGARVPVIPEAHPKSNCTDGWYELVSGGFVCGRYATLDLSHPRVKLGPHSPNLAGPLPYEYGYNLTNGTPLYRQIPSREERMKLEPWLSGKPKKSPKNEDVASSPYEDLDAGSPTLTGIASRLGSASDPLGLGVGGSDALDAGASTTPWYLRDWDGGKPLVSLDELKGEGPIARRMVRGFYVALDKELSANGSKWWRTTNTLVAPYDRMVVVRAPTEFHGLWLDEAAWDKTAHALGPAGIPTFNGTMPVTPGDAGAASAAAPAPTAEASGAAAALADAGPPAQEAFKGVGFILYPRAHKWLVSADKKKVSQGEPVSRFTTARLTGQTLALNGYTYDETVDGWWIRSNEGTKTKPGPAPADLQPGEKWIDVNLTTQTLVAFQGDKAVFATLISSGRKNEEDKEKDHRTPTGSFRIREKHVAATMDGDHAVDGPYSIEDVPWIMYFQGSYALHGAFWHSNFGRMQSHGCVNLAPADARALFGWTDPPLPDGWHAVWSTPAKPGTRVIVHD